MWKDILIIFIVIISSYIFTLSSIQKFDNQLTFILIQLLILIIFKMIYYKNNIVNSRPIENFQTTSTTTTTAGPSSGSDDLSLKVVNDWIESVNSSVASGTISDNSLNQLSTEANKLQTKLDKVSNEILSLKELITMKDSKSDVDKATINTLNTATIQSNQNENLKKLAKDIKTAKALLEDVSIKQQSKEYPKIPVYSSCVVSNADGGYTLDTPNKDAQSQKDSVKDQVSQKVSNIPSNLGLVNTLSHIFDKGINVKIN